MESNNIVNIAVENIYQHPDNPRKDLGDLSELTESIKKKGVMQNLTVIPGHYITDEEWSEIAAQYKENPTEELRNKMNTIHSGKWLDEGYTLIIGHRRCAAAKLAGLKELPCRVVDDMSKKDQVSTMLEENMQRNDLTIWEQANGFQMMLDLGETEDSIAEKTGFSKTTVRHRMNIAKLNQKVLREKEKDDNFQLSLKDLYELEKIPDIKKRDKILKEARDSNNLVQMARSTVHDMKRKEREKAYIKLCKEDGIKPAPDGAENERYSGKWEIIKEFNLDEDIKGKTGCKAKAKEKELFYIVYWGRTFTIITKKPKEKKELTPAEIAEKERNKRIKEIKAMRKVMATERVEFIKTCIKENFKPESGKPEDVQPRLFNLLIKAGGYLSESTMRKFFTGEGCFPNDKPTEEIAEYEKQRDSLSLLHKMMIYAADSVGEKDLTEYNGTYRKEYGDLVMELDKVFALFGFSYSKEEFYKLAEGTHDLYKEENNATDKSK